MSRFIRKADLCQAEQMIVVDGVPTFLSNGDDEDQGPIPTVAIHDYGADGFPGRWYSWEVGGQSIKVNDGDYLVAFEGGLYSVMPADRFEAGWEPFLAEREDVIAPIEIALCELARARAIAAGPDHDDDDDRTAG